ncbi:Eco57I restriction-modification methylase domain-containing protein [Rhizobium sp.]|uniref:Eco57I restriction-modification methylase domain-containing protein n=1 Tax=Rhizobium sp. TaxID=391 RepID=UPI00289BB5EF
MPVPDKVVALIERFEEHRTSYVQPGYKEARLRSEFLDDLFVALGWDIRNSKGYAEAYKDVVVEDALSIDGSNRAPDYSFRIGGVRKFFVEAKAPSVKLKENPDAAFQLRRYGWSAKLPLSVLTNFSEIAVYDCSVRPVITDKASKSRVLYVPLSELAEKWDDLASIFSYDAIVKGGFDKFVSDKARRRGTAEVDAAFLQEVEGWRESLARNIALRNRNISIGDLNAAVQRTIDRIIFLRIAEDRGIEPYGRLLNAGSKRDVYSALGVMFQQADQRYNSGLFHFDPADGNGETLDDLTLSLDIDDKVLKPLLQGLYYPKSPYAFSVLPADILGQVYEQFLGKVITLKGRSATIDEKPEVRKAGGVFYTPTFVVRHIVQETLGPLLRGLNVLKAAGLDKRVRNAQPIRIIDPACGSGSFLIEAYQYLLDWYLQAYIDDGALKHARGAEPRIYKTGNSWKLSISEKRRILTTHIFGVDIDEQAVEVTKLSLLLKLLEGENADVVAAQVDLFHRRVLPDLWQNIKSGNSLVESDFFDGKADLLCDEDRIRLNSFDWDVEFEFKFDAVIGNPPYGAVLSNDAKPYLQSRFVYKKGKPETYLFFMERGLDILKKGGRLGYIVPNAWMTNFYGAQMRKFILEKSAVVGVTDLEPVRVFKAAVVDTCVLLLEKDGKATKVSVSRGRRDKSIREEFRVNQAVWSADPDRIFNVYADTKDSLIIAKMSGSGRRLGDIVEYSQGVIPYITKAAGQANLHISKTMKNGWLPLIESAEQVSEYDAPSPMAHINYGPWLTRPREARFFNQDKILFHRVRKKLPRQLVGALDTSKAINRHALSNLVLRDGHEPAELRAALALFNSPIANWWFAKRFGPLMEVGGFKVEAIPLPTGWDKVWPALANQADILSANLPRLKSARVGAARTLLLRHVAAARRKIDQQLEAAFGLTTEEAAYVRDSYRALVEREFPEADEQDLDVKETEDD